MAIPMVPNLALFEQEFIEKEGSEDKSKQFQFCDAQKMRAREIIISRVSIARDVSRAFGLRVFSHYSCFASRLAGTIDCV